MRIFLTLALIIFLSHTSVLAQIVVGKYHLSSTGKDYVVLVDDMQNRYKGKTINKQLKKCQIYLQVESSSNDIAAFIEMTSGDIKGFIKNLDNHFSKAQRYSNGMRCFRVLVGDGDVNLFMKYHNDATGNDIYGYESGQDYNIYYERNEEGHVFITYYGEQAKSEGKDGLAINGWQLILSSEEEIQVIDELLQKAQAMIKSNSAEL